MKILHVADFLPGFHKTLGGAEFAALRTIEEQQQRGVDVDIATLRFDAETVARDSDRPDQIGNLDRFAPGPAYVIKQLFYPGDPIAACALTRIIGRKQPDVIHFHNLHFSGLSTVLAAARTGIPVAMTIYDYWLFCPSFMLLTNKNELCQQGHGAHCVDCVGTRRAAMLRPLKRLGFAMRPRVFGQVRNAVDAFITLSSASGRLLTQHGVDEKKVHAIHQPVWQQAVAAGEAGPATLGRLLYVGWVEARKGLHIAIEALAKVASEFSELKLDVLGMAANTAYEQEIRDLIQRLGLQDRVNFLGQQSRDGLLEALQDAFLVLVPEQWENMSPVIVTEAMAAGACVLASRVGGIPEFVIDGESGLLAERADAAAFAAQIRYAMANPLTVETMRRAARQRAQKVFDPGELHQQHLDVYRRLTGAN